MDEFALIREHFTARSTCRGDVLVGVGDDAAILAPEPGTNLVCTTDFLLEGVHFPAPTDPHAVGHKALAVNLSDLAAMGARPAWATLLLSMPTVDSEWISSFSTAFHTLAGRYGVQLVGGDLARGPLAVGVQTMGYVDPGMGMLRSGARAGDEVYVSGRLGDAYIGLKVKQGQMVLSAAEQEATLRRLEYPEPRVALGIAVVELAHAAIDISDGLYGDLGHIANASGLCAHIELDRVPISDVYRKRLAELGWDPALCAGDDYELCFTAAPGREFEVARLARRLDLPLTKIGRMEAGAGVRVHDRGGGDYVPHSRSYDHFA